ncbi:DUF4260 family protein [Lacibacter luteus]|uniref:DUF4260 family protein n=1 Tax=Lacibacter luteus TaxID=2508719 RepID=A0A4Q1CLK1_9BACT|nr:DUF4260 domain-containing protein [Lacibacter luteus]RXK61521.1 DUF4260 family protein [Lacibacter luteus]
MKTILKLEELAMLLVSIALLYISTVEWWWYLLMFIGPDISMLGYLAGNKTGAILYNIFHHKAIAILVIAVSLVLKLQFPFFDSDPFIQAGIVLFGHSSMDRVFGYGLKYENGFKFTHLGEIGKK